ncbi:MAG: 2-phospho-L-lactate transferase [Anaerolineales bacterium]
MKVTALAGGVGGAKLAHGLALNLEPSDLTIIVNTADDFEHFGLHISPDLDTVCYTLAEIANPQSGWGRSEESWVTMSELKRLGAPDWFQLGDRDLATHLERTRRLKSGESLSQVTAHFCQIWGIRHPVLPMSDDPVRTWVVSDIGDLPFQEYFVRHHFEPAVRDFQFRGMENAKPAPGVLAALQQADVILFCPSNPFVSIDPILAISEIRQACLKKKVIAVSPIVGGKAVKGPAAKMFAELGISPSPLAVAQHYAGLIQGFVLDTLDSEWEAEIQLLKMDTLVTNTLMNTAADRYNLAKLILMAIEGGLL